MQRARLMVATLALLGAGSAVAGPTINLGLPLGNALGHVLGVNLGGTLGHPLGTVMGLPLGEVLPLASSGVFVVAAASLGLGIYIARRKRRR
jgi:hypothetical protein